MDEGPSHCLPLTYRDKLCKSTRHISSITVKVPRFLHHLFMMHYSTIKALVPLLVALETFFLLLLFAQVLAVCSRLGRSEAL